MIHLRNRLWAGLLAGVILLMGACGAGVKTDNSKKINQRRVDTTNPLIRVAFLYTAIHQDTLH